MRKILLVILLLNTSEGLLAQNESAVHIGYNFGLINTTHSAAKSYKTPKVFTTHNLDLGLHFNKVNLAVVFCWANEVQKSSLSSASLLLGYRLINKDYLIIYPQIGIVESQYKAVVSQSSFAANTGAAISGSNSLEIKNSNKQFVLQLNADHFPGHSSFCLNYKIGYAGSYKSTEWEADNMQTTNPYKDSFSNIFASIGIKLFLGI